MKLDHLSIFLTLFPIFHTPIFMVFSSFFVKKYKISWHLKYLFISGMVPKCRSHTNGSEIEFIRQKFAEAESKKYQNRLQKILQNKSHPWHEKIVADGAAVRFWKVVMLHTSVSRNDPDFHLARAPLSTQRFYICLLPKTNCRIVSWIID